MKYIILNIGEKMAIDLVSLVINIIVSVIIVSPVLWISGRSLVGKEKAKFTDAIWIVVIGIVVGTILGAFLTGIVGTIVLIIIWLALVKHFFDCGWLQALAISIIAAIIFVVIVIILGLIGIAIVTTLI
ncbi:MAG: hypothetical protein QXP60_02150 [Nitrososphaerota archaeon]